MTLREMFDKLGRDITTVFHSALKKNKIFLDNADKIEVLAYARTFYSLVFVMRHKNNVSAHSLRCNQDSYSTQYDLSKELAGELDKGFSGGNSCISYPSSCKLKISNISDLEKVMWHMDIVRAGAFGDVYIAPSFTDKAKIGITKAIPPIIGGLAYNVITILVYYKDISAKKISFENIKNYCRSNFPFKYSGSFTDGGEKTSYKWDSDDILILDKLRDKPLHISEDGSCSYGNSWDTYLSDISFLRFKNHVGCRWGTDREMLSPGSVIPATEGLKLYTAALEGYNYALHFTNLGRESFKLRLYCLKDVNKMSLENLELFKTYVFSESLKEKKKTDVEMVILPNPTQFGNGLMYPTRKEA